MASKPVTSEGTLMMIHHFKMALLLTLVGGVLTFQVYFNSCNTKGKKHDSKIYGSTK